MILLAALLAAAPVTNHKSPAGPADPRSPQARFSDCVKQSDADPAAAVKAAKAWAGSGGGVLAGQCLGIAQSAAGDWKAAAGAFSAAATIADTLHDDRAPTLWVSAGNAALAGDDAATARSAFGTALASAAMPAQLRGETFLDRARADVAQGDLPSARADMNEALRLVPDDPMAWLLSATLARRMSDGPRATTDIREAMLRSPNEAPVLFEAGNIAASNGDMEEARRQWARARIADPQSDAGRGAAAELAAAGGDSTPAAKKAPTQGR
ncbi:MAG: hypothetical protein JWO65_56 [Sphingomonas bacterium]|nr:hypothetical protein [Sphingomonas bacterium]